MELKFSAVILQHEDTNAAYIEVPYDIKKLFGKDRLPVNAAFDGIPYRGAGSKNGHPLLYDSCYRTDPQADRQKFWRYC